MLGIVARRQAQHKAACVGVEAHRRLAVEHPFDIRNSITNLQDDTYGAHCNYLRMRNNVLLLTLVCKMVFMVPIVIIPKTMEHLRVYKGHGPVRT